MSTTGGEIVDRIEAALARSEMTARQLAEAAGLDESVLSKVRSGSRNLKASELTRLADALGVSPLVLLRDDSMLSRLPIAGRAGGGSGGGDAYLRIVALTELHEVLDRGGIPARPLDDRCVSVIPTHTGWLAATSALAQRALEAISIDDGDDRFAALVTAIGEHLHVDVLVEAFSDDSLIGAALTDRRFPFLFVNASQSRQRALFTLAHELGHLLAGHTGDGVWDRAKSFAGKTPEERIANAFAAEFLMPVASIRKIIAEEGRGARCLATMILQFGVSYESLVYRLHNSKTVNAEGRVVFGATVKLLDEDNGTQTTYQIVGDDEANIAQGMVSISSPIARALIGKESGESVEVRVPDGTRHYEILDVSY